jgi:hypothetical protein
MDVKYIPGFTLIGIFAVLSGMPLLSSGITNYAYARYAPNTQTLANNNECDNGANCANPSAQSIGDGTTNAPVNSQTSEFSGELSTPGPTPEPNQQLQVRQVNADTPTLIVANSRGTSVANCDPTEDVTGGGYIYGELGTVLSNEINPQVSEMKSGNGWEVGYFNPGPRDVNLLAFAECASLLP